MRFIHFASRRALFNRESFMIDMDRKHAMILLFRLVGALQQRLLDLDLNRFFYSTRM